MLDDILKIKRIREDNATAALAEARRQLEACVHARDEQRARADAFRDRRPALEDALFEEIRNQLVELKGLDEVRDKVSALRAEEFRLYEEVERLDREVASARERVAARERERMEAHRNVEKYETLIEEARAAERAEDERKQEVEVEDSLTRAPSGR